MQSNSHDPNNSDEGNNNDIGNNESNSKIDLKNKDSEIFLKLVKKWLIKYNNFNSEDKNNNDNFVTNINNINSKTAVILNIKVHLARIKVFVDFIELNLNCPKFGELLIEDFVKFSKNMKMLAKKILVSSNKIKSDAIVFTDIIILNYPYMIRELDIENFHKLINSNVKTGNIIGFSKVHVLKVKSPSIVLWSKKILCTCKCREEKNFFWKIYNIYKVQKSFNNDVYNTFCTICKKEYIVDKNSEIFIESQEITFAVCIEEDRFINNIITVWAYGDLINSVIEGNTISLVAFYIPNECKNNYEKDFNYGRFVALNFNMYFEPNYIIFEKNFKIKFPKQMIDNIINRNNRQDFSLRFNENLEIDILRSIKFQRQLNVNMNKFLLNNFMHNYKKNLIEQHLNENVNGKNDYFNIFLLICLDLSIVQRDYFNKIYKSAFFEEELLLRSKNKIVISKNKNETSQNYLTHSRNLVLKTKIFGKEKLEKKENEIYKYFRLARQSGFENIFDESQLNYLLKPLNLFLIFDSLNTMQNNLVSTVYKYSKLYNRLITIYPCISNKFNKGNMLKFFLTWNNCIVLIPDVELLTKQEIELILNIMNNGIYLSNANEFNIHDNKTNNNMNLNFNDNCSQKNSLKLNITFWICSSNYKICHNKKKNKSSSCSFNYLGGTELKNKIYFSIIEKCEIVLNLSKNSNCLRSVEIGASETKMSDKNNIKNFNFQTDFSSSLSLDDECLKFINLEEFSILKKLNDDKILTFVLNEMCKENHFYNSNSKNNSNGFLENFDDSFSAAKLIEDYFLKKRELSNINFDDFFSILRIATFYSMLRCNYDNKTILYPKTIENLNYLDVILTIFIFEEFCVFKYGLECSSFGNIIPKIINYDFSNNFIKTINELKNLKSKEMSENKTHIPKTRSSLRKIFISENQYSNFDKKKELDCLQCTKFLKIGSSEKIEDFLEKLTIFTYNN